MFVKITCKLQVACGPTAQGLWIPQAIRIWGGNFLDRPFHLPCVKESPSPFSIPQGSHSVGWSDYIVLTMEKPRLLLHTSASALVVLAFCELCSMSPAKHSLLKCASQLNTKNWDHKKVGLVSKCKNRAKSKGTAVRKTKEILD